MNNLQNRIDSFKNSTVKWPHTEAQFHKVDSFAKAGFYFVRRPKAIDSLRCFLCDVELSHWKSGQSPFSRHSKESPNCALSLLNFPDANNKPLTVNHRDQKAQPRGPAMRAARIATFNHHNFWPPNKGMLSKTRRYPAASKLADAGFFFSPTNEHTARIKCPYCRIEIEDPDKNVNILDKHQELSSDCLFFAPTHNMRATKNRRDTVDSNRSNDTFKTANSDLEEESMDMEVSMYEPSFTKSKKPMSKPIGEVIESSSEHESDFEGVNKAIKKITQSKAKKPTTTKKPIKIVKRQKSSDTLTKVGSNKRKRDEYNTDQATKESDDIWSIEQTFTPSTIVRKPAITFGNRKVRQLPSTRRVGTSSIDIFSKLKPTSPIAKLTNESTNNMNTNGIESKAPCSKKRFLIETPKIIDPITEKKSSKNLSVNKSTTSRKVTLNSSSQKSSTKTSTKLDNISEPAHNSFSSSTSSPLKPSSSSNLSSDSQKSPCTDQPISEENIEPVVINPPHRDKGKGRAIEFNLMPTSLASPAIKKPISLSRSKSKSMKVKELESSALSTEQTPAMNNPATPLDPTIAHVSSSSAPMSSSNPNIPIPEKTETAAIRSPVAPMDTMMSEIYDPTLPEGFLDDLPDANTIMETTPPTEFMDRTPSPQLASRSLSPKFQTRASSPVKKTFSPQFSKSTPSPILRQRDSQQGTPPPLSPTTRARNLKYMQSTPNQASNAITAFDIFGNCPLSPIQSTTRFGQGSIYQDTPVMHQSGRTRQVIMKDVDGTPQRIMRPEAPLPPPLDINTILPVATISEEHRKMKVKDYLQHLVDQNIEKVRKHGLSEIKEIQALSEKIKSALTSDNKK